MPAGIRKDVAIIEWDPNFGMAYVTDGTYSGSGSPVEDPVG